jgi:hypothetical protein
MAGRALECGIGQYATSRKKKLILTLTAKADGKDAPYPVPEAYSLYLYRKEMNISYAEMMATPLEVINRDIEFMDIEGQVRAMKESKAHAKSKQ